MLTVLKILQIMGTFEVFLNVFLQYDMATSLLGTREQNVVV